MKLTENQRAERLVFLCCLVYCVSYLTRYNYGAALAEIVSDMAVSKEQASLAVTGMFITYGLGQLLSGWLGDRLPPRYVIFGGMTAASLCNLGMLLMADMRGMTVLWCINGLAQAMLWPPMVRILAENLSVPRYRKASLRVSIAASLGSIAVYLMVPACIALSGWRSAFLLPGLMGLGAAAAWLIWEPGCEAAPEAPPMRYDGGRGTSLGRILCTSGLLFVLPAIILQGMLRDGVTTWMPTYISETFPIGTGISILTTVVLPVFSILSISAASWLQSRTKNDLSASGLLFLLAAAAGGLLSLFGSSGAVVSVLCMMLITGCMHGVNMLLISRLPAFFAGYGRVSAVSGLLNTFTYVGSAASAYGFAAVSQRMGWGFTAGLWAAIAALGAVCCLAGLPSWRRFLAAPGKKE